MIRSAANTVVKSIIKTALFFGLVGGGSVGVWYYQQHHSAAYQIQQLEEKNQRLEQDKQHLKVVVERLSDEKRVAEIIVTRQTGAGDQMRTWLLFVEYAKDGSSLPPKRFVIDGNGAHLDAMVIKFDRGFVEESDPLRGRSIALFTKLYGDRQTPERGFNIDAPGQIPDIYGGDTQVASEQAAFERDLWQNFWRLADDKSYRESKGVRVANGQGVWGPFVEDQVYTVKIESNGGLNLTHEPMKGIYREALRQQYGEPLAPSTRPTQTPPS